MNGLAVLGTWYGDSEDEDVIVTPPRPPSPTPLVRTAVSPTASSTTTVSSRTRKKDVVRKKKRKLEVEEKESEEVEEAVEVADPTRGLVLYRDENVGSNHEEWLVERVLKKWVGRNDGAVWYRIKWEGWDKSYNSWEPIQHLSNCSHLLEEFDANERRKAIQRKLRVRGSRARNRDRQGSTSSEVSLPQEIPEKGDKKYDQSLADTPSPPVLNLQEETPAVPKDYFGLEVPAVEHEDIGDDEVELESPAFEPFSDLDESTTEDEPKSVPAPETATDRKTKEHETESIHDDVAEGGDNHFYRSEESSSEDEMETATLHRLYTPNFYRRWPKGKVPLEIVGSACVSGAWTHLVRLKPDSLQEIRTVLENPAEGISFANSIIVTHNGLQRRFPDLLDDYIKRVSNKS